MSRGIDIRQYGSGNVGASNLKGITSKWVMIPTVIFDLAKGALMVWAAHLMGLGIAQQATVGVAVVVGHNWPVFLRFSGGRGVITVLGVTLILPIINGFIPWEMLAFLIIAAIGVAVTHRTPLGAGIGIAALPVVSWVLNESLPMTFGFLAMFVIVFIRRLIVPRTPATASISYRQLLVNRLLCDRDIRDRNAWMHRAPPKVSSLNYPSNNTKKQGKG